jgi:hypothetical protein
MGEPKQGDRVSANRTKAKRIKQPAKMLWPLISRPEPVADLSESQLAALEKAGQLSLTPASRLALNNIAESWTSHDRALHTPRPAEFESRLLSIRKSLQRAYAKADLNRDGASPFERQLYHWLLELPGAADALSQLASLTQIIEFLLRAEQSLPADSGSVRPMDDERFIQYLADQFVACGGKARAYVSDHSDEGYAKTPFRQFVHRFYGFLSLKSRRTRSGLDEAIRTALRQRRRGLKV